MPGQAERRRQGFFGKRTAIQRHDYLRAAELEQLRRFGCCGGRNDQHRRRRPREHAGGHAGVSQPFQQSAWLRRKDDHVDLVQIGGGGNSRRGLAKLGDDMRSNERRAQLIRKRLQAVINRDLIHDRGHRWLYVQQEYPRLR